MLCRAWLICSFYSAKELLINPSILLLELFHSKLFLFVFKLTRFVSSPVPLHLILHPGQDTKLWLITLLGSDTGLLLVIVSAGTSTTLHHLTLSMTTSHLYPGLLHSDSMSTLGTMLRQPITLSSRLKLFQWQCY